MNLNDFFGKNTIKEPLILQSLFVLYLLFNVNLPFSIAQLIDHTVGKIIIFILALSLFKVSLVTGVLGMLVAYTMIKRSANSFSSPYYHSNAEVIKMDQLKEQQDDPETLEQEMVSKMSPIIESTSTGTFKPVVYDLPGSSPLSNSEIL